MDNRNTCRFCNIANGKYQYKEIDQPFASSEEYFAMASIGAMVEGWSLVIPKEHQLSMRNNYNNENFVDFIKIVTSCLITQYGPLIAFEHGSNQEGSITACGTDHAHLHLVPFCESFVPELQNSKLEWFRCQTSKISNKVGNNEYLFYYEIKTDTIWQDPIGYLHVLDRPISQFFRHLIASRLGYGETYDYRKYPYLENARKTRDVLVRSVG